MEELKQFLEEKVMGVLEETLENMAFLSVEETDAQFVKEFEGERLNVSLLITKPTLFEMRLEMPHELLVQIVETVYTIDQDEITTQLIDDLLAEILNTLAGRFMTEILPTDQTFDLSLPEVTNEVDESAEATRFTFYYMAEDYPLTVELTAADSENLSFFLNN